MKFKYLEKNNRPYPTFSIKNYVCLSTWERIITSFHWLDRSQQLVEEIQELWKQDFAEKEVASRMRSTEALRILF